MTERYLLKNPHNFVFVTEESNGVCKFVCKGCGVKVDSKTLYVMDREECLAVKKG